jgi:methyl-accepting chemotaxis protein
MVSPVSNIQATLPSDDPVQRAGAFRAVLNNYAARDCDMAAAQRTVGFSENAGFEGNLREAVHQIEARLSEFDEPRLTILMLATKEAVGRIHGISETVGEMEAVAKSIAQTVNQQHAATRKISASVTEASQGGREVAQRITGVSGDTERARDAARRALEMALAMAERSAGLHRVMREMLGRIRAAWGFGDSRRSRLISTRRTPNSGS